MKNTLATVRRAEALCNALGIFATEPAAAGWDMLGDRLNVGLIQFFPSDQGGPGHDRRNKAAVVADLIGGEWYTDGDDWQCTNPTYPGFAGNQIVLHWVEPTTRKSDKLVDLASFLPPPPMVCAAPNREEEED